MSEPAKTSLDRLFKMTLARHVSEISGQACQVETLLDTSAITGQEFALITLSSSVFKCLNVFHLNYTERALQMFSSMSSRSASAFNQTQFRDAFLEFCNMCCGTMNRELHQYFPHLGMSTPYFLASDCIPFFRELKPGLEKNYRMTLDSGLVLHASLYVCDFGLVDFTASYQETTEQTGELEMF